MKHVLVSIILLGSLTAFSQEKSKNPKIQKERIEQAKIAFLTKKLELTSEEAQQFWPIYNEKNNKLKELRVALKKEFAPIKEGKENQNDATYKALVTQMHEGRENKLKIEKEYTDRIGELLGYKRVFDLSTAEKEFKKGLMERMKRSNPGKKGEMGRPQQRNLIDKN